MVLVLRANKQPLPVESAGIEVRFSPLLLVSWLVCQARSVSPQIHFLPSPALLYIAGD